MGSQSIKSTVTSGSFSVAAVSPASGATQVVATAIQINFSAAADPATVNTSTIVVTAPESIPGTVGYSAGSDIATFTPTNGFAENSTYTVTVSGVTSSTGIAMAAPFVSSFGTMTTVSANPPVGPCMALIASTPFQCTTYLSPLASADGTVGGDVAIDDSGDVSVEFSPATVNTIYTVQFCPAYNSGSPAPACFDVGTMSTSDAPPAKTILMFPQPGSWAGDFQVVSGSTVICQTGWPAGPGQLGVTGNFFASTLEPESTVNGTGLVTGKTQDPLSYGLLAYSETQVQFSVTGAAPNASYTVFESVSNAVNGAGSYPLTGTLTTNASGDDYGSGVVEFSPPISGYGGDIFEVVPQDSSHAGWISGFSVPQ